MRIFIALALLLLSVANGPAFAQGKSDPLQTACTSGDPWFLPAAPAKGETSILVVAGANPAVRIRLCNCSSKEDGQTFIRVNPTVPNAVRAAPAGKTETTSSATLATQLYVGSCLEATGNIVTIRNTLPKDQRGTYLVR